MELNQPGQDDERRFLQGMLYGDSEAIETQKSATITQMTNYSHADKHGRIARPDDDASANAAASIFSGPPSSK